MGFAVVDIEIEENLLPEKLSTDVVLPFKIPSWIKNNVKWRSKGSLAEAFFIKGIEYVINGGIIKVTYILRSLFV